MASRVHAGEVGQVGLYPYVRVLFFLGGWHSWHTHASCVLGRCSFLVLWTDRHTHFPIWSTTVSRYRVSPFPSEACPRLAPTTVSWDALPLPFLDGTCSHPGKRSTRPRSVSPAGIDDRRKGSFPLTPRFSSFSILFLCPQTHSRSLEIPLAFYFSPSFSSASRGVLFGWSTPSTHQFSSAARARDAARHGGLRRTRKAERRGLLLGHGQGTSVHATKTGTEGRNAPEGREQVGTKPKRKTKRRSCRKMHRSCRR